MEGLEIAPKVYWVGAIDWNVRDFHGYHTPHGSTYNAYLVLDEQVALIDTVKRSCFDEMKARVSHYVDPAKIDVVVSNHVEMDHSSGLPLLMDLAPKASVYCTKRGEAGLRQHYGRDWDFKTVAAGDTLSLGRRTLSFVATPMLHWPDSMMTYLPDEQMLFSMDGFGQHVASSARFDAELGLETALREARTYWANILMPLGKVAVGALDALAGVPVATICPSHGVIWRQHIPDILDAYRRWATHQVRRKAVVVYGTMWHSTEHLALAAAEGLRAAGVETYVFDLALSDLTEVISEVQEAAAIVIGSSTLNQTMLPCVGEFLTYLGGLKPEGRIAAIFGSYGWSRGAESAVRRALEPLKPQMPVADLLVQYVPRADALARAEAWGRDIAQAIDARQRSGRR
jgi:flavorubredoxin